jgi:hypothetical protein
MLRELLNDEAGFIVSAELVLVATVAVLGLIVGLNQVQYSIVQELNDVACAIGSLNQSYYFTGFHTTKTVGGAAALKAYYMGSTYKDEPDACDCSILVCDIPGPECAGAPAP